MTEPKSEQLTAKVTEALKNNVVAYARTNNNLDESEAIRRLVKAGLKHEEQAGDFREQLHLLGETIAQNSELMRTELHSLVAFLAANDRVEASEVEGLVQRVVQASHKRLLADDEYFGE